MIVQIIKEKDLPQEEAINIVQIWTNAFGDGKKIDENKKIKFKKEELFFIIRDQKNEILAVGCLKSVNIKFLKKVYQIKGIGGIVSLIQGKGYGKILMQEIRKYLEKKNFMGIGFCTRKNNPFYKKCNFFVEDDLIHRFVYKNDNGDLHHNPDGDDDVLYFNDKYSLIQQIISSPKAKVYIPFWW